MGGTLIEELVVAAIKGLGGLLLQWISDERAAQAQHDLGAAETAAAVNKTSAERTDAMLKVAADRPSDSDVAGGLSNHTF